MTTLALIDSFARAGGGGSSGGGGGAAGILVLPIVLIMAYVQWRRRKKQLAKAERQLATAQATDSTWGQALQRSRDVFRQFQQDWSTFNVASMQYYLTPEYYQHINLMLQALWQLGRQNVMTRVNLVEANMFNVSDHLDDQQDAFDVEMRASAFDQLVDVQAQHLLFADESAFTEVWHFKRYGGQWMLDGISQQDELTAIEKGYTTRKARASSTAAEGVMRAFALQNGFFYNADFGWLLLPNRGRLFSSAKFGNSDVNYHVIGVYRNVLVQFYQYVPLTADKLKGIDYLKSLYNEGYRTKPYLVAQATLPKSYGNIVVRRKGGLMQGVPRGMTRVSLEGVSFDKQYLVYATDMDKVNSLELLHPVYMEKLLQVPFRVNIEIVDSTLYLYTDDGSADPNLILQLLQAAFEEMRM
jgi:hypothetical protein